MPRFRLIPVLVLLCVTTGCAMSEEKEIAIGQQSHAQFEKEFGGKYPDPELQQYVNGVGMRMARYAKRPKLPWQFAVLNSDQVNAFAVPGGWIYITHGLLFRMDNEAELAGVLGHEAAHIAHRHSVQQIQRAQTAQGLAFVANIAGAFFGVSGIGNVTNMVASLTLMKYGRGQEKQADMSGLKYMTADGYNPQGMVQLMKVLQESSGGKGPPEFLATHPNPGNRLQYLSAEIKKRYANLGNTGRLGEAEFQRYVLAKRPIAHGTIDWSRPSTWCATCRQNERRVAAISGADR